MKLNEIEVITINAKNMITCHTGLSLLAGGFNIKAYFNDLDNYSGDGIGIDFGVLYEINQN